jgi:predicted deacylase
MTPSPKSSTVTPLKANVFQKLNLRSLAKGKIHHFYIHLTDNGLGLPVFLPVIVARGNSDGPTLGFTAGVHGNELNGIKVIHKLIQELEEEILELHGTIIAVPMVNPIGALSNQRTFNNGEDLNRIMPGKARGNSSAQFVHRFIKEVIKKMDYLVDLHTASFGRVNSLYVRVDLEDQKASKMAQLQHPQIIVHNKSRDGSLRGAAEKLGIPSITVEVGDPQRFQNKLIRESLVGIHNIIGYLKMLPWVESHIEKEPVICSQSYWTYTDRGGLLEIFPHVTDFVKKGQVIAKLVDLFGNLICEYKAPQNGVVVGKSVNPISQTGARILHLGIPKEKPTQLAKPISY